MRPARRENIDDPAVRKRYGAISSFVGIFCNLLLFLLKLATGVLTNSVSILSDGFNNLSDSTGSFVTLFGYKAAAKPADRDHPFGHGRMESMAALSLSVLILFVGVELLRSSIDKIRRPEPLQFSVAALVVLLFSIALKIWLAVFNRRLGRRIHSPVLLATATDSRNDVLATAAAAIALIASRYTDLPVDGIMGVAVSLFILKSGYSIMRDTVDELLGKPASPELCEQIRQILTSDPHILGIHDLILHSYGAATTIGSCHAEVRCDENILKLHEIIDRLERRIAEDLHVILTVHTDPVEPENPHRHALKAKLREILLAIDPRLTFHDFRFTAPTEDGGKGELLFDLTLPADCTLGETEIKRQIDRALEDGGYACHTVVTFDRMYTESICE